MKQPFHILSLTALLIICSVFSTFAANSQQIESDSAENIVIQPLDSVVQLPATNRFEKQDFLRDGDGNLRVIVELKAPSVVARQMVQDGAVDFAQRSVSAEQSAILAEQQAVLDALSQGREAISAELHHSLLVNAISLSLPAELLESVEQNSAVKAVYPEKIYQLSQDHLPLDQLANLVEQNERESRAVAAGMKIAVIDSGIEPSNAMFSNVGLTMPSGYPKGECQVNGLQFCN